MLAQGSGVVCIVGVSTDSAVLLAGSQTKELKLQLDYQLCHTEHKSSQWHKMLGKHHFRAENITDLMELVYFLWFEARQLTRAAKMLAKVRQCNISSARSSVQLT